MFTTNAFGQEVTASQPSRIDGCPSRRSLEGVRSMKVQIPLGFMTGCRAVGFPGESLRHNMVSDVCWDTMAMKHFYSWNAAPTRKLPDRQKPWAISRKAIKGRLLLIEYPKARSKRVKGTAQQVHL